MGVVGTVSMHVTTRPLVGDVENTLLAAAPPLGLCQLQNLNNGRILQIVKYEYSISPLQFQTMVYWPI